MLLAERAGGAVISRIARQRRPSSADDRQDFPESSADIQLAGTSNLQLRPGRQASVRHDSGYSTAGYMGIRNHLLPCVAR